MVYLVVAFLLFHQYAFKCLFAIGIWIKSDVQGNSKQL